MDRVHLSHLQLWEGNCDGRDGLRALVREIVEVLEFLFVQAQSIPGAVSSTAATPVPDGRTALDSETELARAMAANMPNYWQLLQEVTSP